MPYNKIVTTVLGYIKDFCGAEPEFLWARSAGNAAIRHPDTKKWFAALLLNTPRRVLNLPGEGSVDILDLKCDPMMIGSLVDGKKILPGYHMNKEHWITVLLDGSVPPAEIFPLIDLSFQLTAEKKSGSKKRSTP